MDSNKYIVEFQIIIKNVQKRNDCGFRKANIWNQKRHTGYRSYPSRGFTLILFINSRNSYTFLTQNAVPSEALFGWEWYQRTITERKIKCEPRQPIIGSSFTTKIKWVKPSTFFEMLLSAEQRKLELLLCNITLVHINEMRLSNKKQILFLFSNKISTRTSIVPERTQPNNFQTKYKIEWWWYIT